MSELIYGRNPVFEALKADRTFEKLLLQKNVEGSARKIASQAREKKIPIQYVEKAILDRLTNGAHQGVVAQVSDYRYLAFDELMGIASSGSDVPFLLVLDGIQDPHNLGAILRSADGAGVQGVVIGSRRAVGVTDAVTKVSAGAAEFVPVARVSNLTGAVEQLKKAGYWVTACDMDGQAYDQADLTGPLALVIGGEDQGVSRSLREAADQIVSIPMLGKIQSLNASNAAAVIMYEVRRQRRLGTVAGRQA
ncbi:MAG TPA: 23S rRNA (guanosine(2251)-2'-O)-methyltransferase RlmB [Clostridiales bacterium]|jgi:23S rRNA (guanosine2251-2'-O)-methyltransferase|nr:23S rRNA (guanosine(2251)-2'-O)-methyltransferase RlmB [Clostridiales bacterium]